LPGIGEQLIAPTGYQSLEANQLFHYLGVNDSRDRVLLCTFSNESVHLQSLDRDEFEQAISRDKLVSRDPQLVLPEWLAPLIERSEDPADSFSLHNYKQRHKKAVKKRFKRIKKFTKNPAQALHANRPLQKLRKHARKRGYNESRVSRDFCLYVAYRSTIWALLPSNHLKGSYERADRPDMKKRGPKHKAKGSDYGWPVTEKMRQKMYRGYDRFSGPGVPLTTIYQRTLTKIFKCKTRRQGARTEFYHPKTKPFPSWDQFRNNIVRHYGADRIRTDKLGEQRTRTKKRPSKGAFTALVANINEQIYADGYFLPEVPRSERDDKPMKPMVVVRIRDVASGPITGIGFDVGGETAQAYRSAVFCKAIAKPIYGRLMGLEICEEDWPTVGLPQWMAIDRGPGSGEALLNDFADEVIIHDIAPSYAGQSKAVIESSNPRNTEVSGAPTHFLSDLSYVKLAQREIRRAIRDNHRMDVSDRLTPDMVRAGVAGNPLAIYGYLDERYRNDSRQVIFEDAVRSLLPKISVNVTERGVEFHRQLFDSDELRETRALNRAASKGVFELPGYMIPLCLRQLWVEIDGMIVECQAKLAIRDDDSQLHVSIDELIELEEQRRLADRLDLESRLAVDAAFEQQFEDESGEEWDGGSTRSGKAATEKQVNREEFKETKAVMTGGQTK